MKLNLLLAGFASAFALNALAAEKIVVGATPVPHAEILQFIQPDIKAAGFELEIKEFNDYVQPNMATENGEIDANFFQHTPHLEAYNKEKNGHLVIAAGIHLEPMGVYSQKHKTYDVKEGTTIAIPNDTSNEARALDIIAGTGVVKFKEGALKTKLDIVENPKKIDFKELEAAQVPRSLADVDYAVINSNYAMDAGLNPVKDSLIQESAENNPYVNIVVVKAGNENTPKTKALINALKTQKVKDFILERYKGAVVPAF